MVLSEIGNEEISEDRCHIMYKNLQLGEAEFHMTVGPCCQGELSLLLTLPTSPVLCTAISPAPSYCPDPSRSHNKASSANVILKAK